MVHETYWQRLAHVMTMGSRDPFAQNLPPSHRLRVGFSWSIKPEYACFYFAQQHGYYSSAGLSIEFRPGNGAESALQVLRSGGIDLLVLPCPFAVSAIQGGAPVKIMALYQQVAPVCLVSHDDCPVRHPRDLEGKAVAMLLGETGTAFLEHFCQKNAVDYEKVGRRNTRPQDKLDAFRRRDVDVISVYRTNELPILKSSLKNSLAELDLAAFGLKIPGMCIVTTDTLLDEQPQILRRFLQATSNATAAALTKRLQLQTVAQALCNHDNEADIVRQQLDAFVGSLSRDTTAPFGFCDDRMINAYLAETGVALAGRPCRYTAHLEPEDIDGHGSAC